MAETPKLVNVTPRSLSDDEVLAIGRIVRACADLEDCLNLWICKLAGTDEAKVAVILGRSNIATKIAIAEGLANLRGKRDLQRQKKAFDANITRLLQCRNAVAHGVFAGETEAGYLVFTTNNTLGYEDDGLTRRADAYALATLNIIAGTAAVRVGGMDAFLGLRALRKRRKWRRLPVHQVGQPKGRKASKPKRPPRSSRAKR